MIWYFLGKIYVLQWNFEFKLKSWFAARLGNLPRENGKIFGIFPISSPNFCRSEIPPNFSLVGKFPSLFAAFFQEWKIQKWTFQCRKLLVLTLEKLVLPFWPALETYIWKILIYWSGRTFFKSKIYLITVCLPFKIHKSNTRVHHDLVFFWCFLCESNVEFLNLNLVFKNIFFYLMYLEKPKNFFEKMWSHGLWSVSKAVNTKLVTKSYTLLNQNIP